MKLTERIEGLVIVLIDMQYGFLGKNVFKKIDKKLDFTIITHQAEVLRFCHRTNTPVIVVESAHLFLGRTICPLLTIVERIPRYRYVHKIKNSAFSTPEMSMYLDEFCAQTLLIMGVDADACVFDTTRTAVQKYEVLTSSTLMSGYAPDVEYERKEWYRQNTTYYSQYNTE
jgi:nicotinamidase-related amidase